MIAQDEETSVVWGMPGSVATAGLCSAVLPLDLIAPKVVPPVLGGVTRDPPRLRLPAQAGEGAVEAFVLSADKQYLVESRLLPVARKAGLHPLSTWCSRSRPQKAQTLVVEVVEAMMTNKDSFFFRDKLPFDHFRNTIIPSLIAARANQRRDPDLVRGGLDRPGAVFASDVPEGDRAAVSGYRIDIVATILSTEVLEKARPASTASSRSSVDCRFKC